MPNKLVELWRQHFPGDARSDDDITIGIGAQFPDLIQRYPDARADYDRMQLPVKTVAQDAAYAAGTPLTVTGKVIAGAGADAVKTAMLNPGIENLKSAIVDPPEAPLPAEEALRDVPGTAAAVARGAMGAGRMVGTMAPALALDAATGGALTPAMPALMGGSFAADTYTQTGDAKSAAHAAVLGAVFPVAGAIGEHVGFKIAKDLLSKGAVTSTEADLIQTGVKNATFQAFGHALNADDYAKDPEKFWDKFIEQTVTLAAPVAMEIPGLVKGNLVKSEIEKNLRDPATQKTLRSRLTEALLPKLKEQPAAAPKTDSDPVENKVAIPPVQPEPSQPAPSPHSDPATVYGPKVADQRDIDTLISLERVNPDMPGLAEMRAKIQADPTTAAAYDEQRKQLDPSSPPPEQIQNSEATPPQAEVALPAPVTAPAVGMVRMYHGGADPTGELNGDRHITPYYDYAKGYADKSGEKVWQVDVPEDASFMKHDEGASIPGGRKYWINTKAPADVMKSAKVADEPPHAPFAPKIGAALEEGKAKLASEVARLETAKEFGMISKPDEMRLKMLKAKAALSGPVAEKIEQARAETNPNPSDAQKEAGNYAKGQVTMDGMNVSIENPKGGTRSGTDADGKPWSVKMPADYGYLKGTEGKDGDHLDVFIGNNPDGYKNVWVIDQKKADGTLDEHKALTGFNSKDEALDAYRKSFSDGKADERIGGVIEMSRAQFKQWVDKGKFKTSLSRFEDKAARDKFTSPMEAVLGRVEGAQAAVRQGVKVGSGRGQSAAVFTESEDPKILFDDANGAYVQRLDAEGQPVLKHGKPVMDKDRTQSSKLIVMQHPSGDIIVATASTNNGKRYVADYRKVAGDKTKVNTPFEDLVKEGWKPLAALKTKEPTKGFIAKLQQSDYKTLRDTLESSRVAGEQSAEAMAGQIEASKDYDREPVDEHKGGDAATGDDEVSAEESADKIVSRGDQRDFTKDHAEAIVDAVSELDAEDLADPTTGVRALTGALIEAGPDAVEAFKVAVRDLIDANKIAPDDAVQTIRSKIYDNKRSDSPSADSLEKSIRSSSDSQSNERLRDSDRGRIDTATGAAGGGERVEAGKEGREVVTLHQSVDRKENGANVAAKQSKSPTLIYQDENGELSANSGTGSEGGHLEGALNVLAGNDRGRDGRAGAAELEGYAQENSLILDPESFQRTVANRREVGSGSEHTVYPDTKSGRVIKITHADLSGTGAVGQSGNVQDYLHGLHLQNEIFGDDLRLEGIVRLDGELPQVVTSQRFIKGRNATPGEISDFMLKSGFKWDSKSESWAKGDVRVSDMVPDNVLVSGGKLFPIDVQITDNGAITLDRAAQIVKDSLVSDANVSADFKAMIENLRGAGADIRLVEPVINGVAKEFGKFQEWKGAKNQVVRVITLGMSDANKPTSESLLNLVHEVFHGVLRDAPEHVQAAVIEAFNKLGSEDAGVQDYLKQLDATGRNLEPGERVIEGITEGHALALIRSGFDPVQARSLTATIWRAVQEIYHGTIMGVQKLLGFPISGDRATRYLQNRLAMAMAGDAPMSLLSWMGGPRAHQTDWENIDESNGVLLNRNLTTVKSFEPVLSKDVDATALNEKTVAASNEIHETFDKIHKDWSSKGFNTAGVSLDDFISNPTFGNLQHADAFADGSLPQQKIANINDGLMTIGQKPVDPAMKMTSMTNSQKRIQAADQTYSVLAPVYGEQSKQRQSVQSALSRKEDRLNSANIRLAEMIKDYTSLETVQRAAVASVQKLSAVFGNGLRTLTQLGRKAGELEQIIRQIDSKADDKTIERYGALVDGIYKRISGNTAEGAKFTDTLENLANLNLDWKGMTPAELAERIKFAFDDSHDPMLAPLLANTDESRALLSVVVAFAKQNGIDMELLQLRRSAASADRAVVNTAIKTAMQGHSTAINEALKAIGVLTNERLRRNAVRILDRINELKKQNLESHDEIQRDKAFLDYHDVAAPIMRAKLNELESIIGARAEEFSAVSGASVIVPGISDTPAQAALKTSELKMEQGGTSQAKINIIIRKQSEWLAAHTKKEGGATWNQIADQNEKLKKAVISDAHDGIRQSFILRWLGSPTDALRSIGTRQAKQASVMWEQNQFESRSRMEESHRAYTEWESSQQRAMRATGIKKEKIFQQMIFSPVQAFIENRQDLLAASKTDEIAVNRAVAEGMKKLLSDPILSRVLSKGEAARAVETYIRKTISSAQFIGRTHGELGLGVKETGQGYTIFRKLIGLVPYTLPKRISERADQMFESKQFDAWDNDVLLDPKKVSGLYQQDPNALRDMLKDKAAKPLWNFFVRGQAHKDGASDFESPDAGGGVRTRASRENVIKAFETSNDLVTFAEHLHQFEGGRSDVATFIGETLNTFQSRYELLKAMRGDTEHGIDLGFSAPKRWLQDARKFEGSPSEFVQYLPYDRSTTTKLVRTMTQQAKFGRDMGAMHKTLDAAKVEQEALASKFRGLEMQFPDLEGKKLRTAIKDEAAKLFPETPWLALQEASKNVAAVEKAKQDFDSMLTMYKNRPPETQYWSNLLSTISYLTVSGPATALSAHSVAFEQAVRKFGFSVAGFKFLAGESKEIGKVAWGSLLQTFGIQASRDAEITRLLNKFGSYDSSATLSRKDQMAAALSHDVGSQNAAMKAVGQGAQALRTAIGLPIGMKPREGAQVYPAFKASVFHWVAQVVQLGNSIHWTKTYKALIGRAVEHFDQNPLDLRDSKFQFDAKTFKALGINEGRPYDYLRYSLSKFGMDLETIARDYIARRTKDPKAPILTDEHYRLAQQQALDEMTLESGVTTRPSYLTNNWLGQMANPMLGWALYKAADAYKGIRNPNLTGGVHAAADALYGKVTGKGLTEDGRKSLDGFKTGLLAYAAILPVGMAFALLRDKFDEDVLGKKSNVEDLTTIHDARSAFLTVLDNTSRVGTFGVAGEIPNYWFNRDNSRPLTVDSRVFFVNTLQNLQRSAMAMAYARNFDYATVVRPALQSLGGNGFLQYAALINNTFSLDNAEARVSNRISVNNYLRVAGREHGMDVRTLSGMMNTFSAPSLIKPIIGRMVLAAMSNDAQGFRNARQEAIAAAREMGKDDPEKEVERQYESSNPLKVVFKTPPSAQEYNKLLHGLNDAGRDSVSSAIRLYTHYGEAIGMTRDGLAKEKTTAAIRNPMAVKDEVLAGMVARLRQPALN